MANVASNGAAAAAPPAAEAAAAKPAGEMEELNRVLKAAKAAQEAYSHFTQEQVGAGARAAAVLADLGLGRWIPVAQPPPVLTLKHHINKPLTGCRSTRSSTLPRWRPTRRACRWPRWRRWRRGEPARPPACTRERAWPSRLLALPALEAGALRLRCLAVRERAQARMPGGAGCPAADGQASTLSQTPTCLRSIPPACSMGVVEDKVTKNHFASE